MRGPLRSLFGRSARRALQVAAPLLLCAVFLVPAANAATADGPVGTGGVPGTFVWPAPVEYGLPGLNSVAAVLDGPGASVYEVALAGLAHGAEGAHGSIAVTRVVAGDGRVLWRHLYEAPDGWYALAGPAAVAPNGDIVMSGHEVSAAGTASEWFVCRLRASDGRLRWRRVVGASASEIADTFGLAMDSDGSVFVAGVVTPATTDPEPQCDGLLVKFDERGRQLWATTLASAGADEFEGVAPDGRGGVFATGSRISDWKTRTGECLLARYNRSGGRVWTRKTCDGVWSPSAPMVADGGVFVTSYGWSTWMDQRPFVSRFTPAGALEWTRYIDGLPGDIHYGSALTVDAAGDVVIAGGLWKNLVVPGKPSLKSMGWVAKLRHRTGRRAWTGWFYNDTADDGYDGSVYALATDGRGRVYVGGGWGADAEGTTVRPVVARLAADTGAPEKSWTMGAQKTGGWETCFAVLACGDGVYAGAGIGAYPDWKSALYRLRP